jgi:hypothetical protein
VPLSGGDARARRDTFPPRCEIAVFFGDFDLRKIGKAEPDKGGLVCNCERLTRQIRLRREHAIKIGHAGKRAIALMITPVGALIALDIGAEAGGSVVKIGGDGIEHTGFGASLHHAGDRAFPRRPSGQGRLARDVIEIFRDRGAFRDGRAVIKPT